MIFLTAGLDRVEQEIVLPKLSVQGQALQFWRHARHSLLGEQSEEEGVDGAGNGAVNDELSKIG
jgi:hypothetical protein